MIWNMELRGGFYPSTIARFTPTLMGHGPLRYLTVRTSPSLPSGPLGLCNLTFSLEYRGRNRASWAGRDWGAGNVSHRAPLESSMPKDGVAASGV